MAFILTSIGVPRQKIRRAPRFVLTYTVNPNPGLPFPKWYRRFVNWLHPGEAQANLFWAAVVGGIGALSAIPFRACIQGILWLWTRCTGSLEEVAAQLPWWQRLLIPAGGGLLAGLTLHFGARLDRRHRSSDYMEAVAVHPGALSIRHSLVKAVSSLLTIGSGGSIGREGAMVQLSAVIGSWLGETIKVSTPRLRLLIACGAAGGLCAVYDVSVAGALFVAEIVLGSIAIESLGPLLIAAATSSVVSRFVEHEGLYFTNAHFRLASVWEIFPYTGLALVVGVAAPGYVWLLRRAEDWLTALVPHVYWRMTLGGLIVGALAIPFPEVWGNGRTVVDLILTNPWPCGILASVLICKVVATAATTGSGAVGGVFTPTLFTGAMLGCLFGQCAHALLPTQTATPEIYAPIAMGSFLAATTRAPLMAILMVFEMTLDYTAILPLLGVSVVAYYTARSFHGDSIYSESLRRKQPRTTAADISALRARAVMQRPPQTVTEATPLSEIARLFARAPYRHILVVNDRNELSGIITLNDLEDLLQKDEVQDQLAADLMRDEIPMVEPDNNLAEALEKFRDYDGERLPVVNNQRDRILLGQISKTDLLLTLSHGLKGSTH